MRRILLAALLMLSFCVQAQDRADATGIIVSMVESDAEDMKCEIYPYNDRIDDQRGKLNPAVQQLIKNGRYIISVAYTDYGVVVVHRKNTEGAKQIFDYAHYLKNKSLKEYLKKGYALKYYNKGPYLGYAIYEYNPKVTKQKLISSLSLDNKKLAKLNAKGWYAIQADWSDVVLQNGHDDVVRQAWEEYEGTDRMIGDFKVKANEGWVVSSVARHFREYRDVSIIQVIYDNRRNKYVGKQALARINSQQFLSDFLAKRVAPGYNIGGVWLGYLEHNLDARVASARRSVEESNTSVFDVLGGLVNSVSGIVNKGQAAPATGVTTNTVSTNSGSTSSTGSSTSKCKRCQGSGKCSPVSSAGRNNACHGSKLCAYCSGTGWNKAGSGEAICKACNGSGKCKTCGGTGLCSLCKGSGK